MKKATVLILLVLPFFPSHLFSQSRQDSCMIKHTDGSIPLRDRMDGSDAVIVGQIMDVTSLPPQSPITEHDPAWHDATVSVWAVLFGKIQKDLTIRFPASRDISWAESPKFKKGEKGIWVLRWDRKMKIYTALDRCDFMPIDPRLTKNDVLRGLQEVK